MYQQWQIKYPNIWFLDILLFKKNLEQRVTTAGQADSNIVYIEGDILTITKNPIAELIKSIHVGINKQKQFVFIVFPYYIEYYMAIYSYCQEYFRQNQYGNNRLVSAKNIIKD
ncbi:hypothetical protein PPERSA_11717 [Pseudocohnilembus persalinus]|uniref:Uncharacterized protein n=1 Tax=Pseudocohnilembus persalinus TaxID=266149 RepID=A0A0V0QGE7_PSEPJ|nr:hypothetical protein PPERSA_11717 [Pseudocohnilembus persalinus]|eukprot:KRX01270.1 hypothetical protein PPERSA_11717 [Pseudocohnilembus persalinus]